MTFICWYFSPEVIVKFIRRAARYYSALIETNQGYPFSKIKVIPLKLFYYQTFFETWHS